MNAGAADIAMQWTALGLSGAVLSAAFAAATARSLFLMHMFLLVAGALAAAALLALGAADAALGQALFGAGLAPVFVLAAMLLSARTAKPRRGGRSWLTIAAAIAAAGAVLWASSELAIAPPARVSSAAESGVSPWFAPLVFVAVAACVGLLGFGERGALERPPLEQDR